MWIQLGITGFGLLTIFFGLPETSAPNILLRRARRLRKLTGNDKLRSQSEISAAGLSLSAVLKDAMIKPFEISIKDPAVMFSHLLIAFVYATYYLFFTAFPLVLQGICASPNSLPVVRRSLMRRRLERQRRGVGLYLHRRRHRHLGRALLLVCVRLLLPDHALAHCAQTTGRSAPSCRGIIRSAVSTLPSSLSCSPPSASS
jgi:hypothetical protein